MDWWCTPPIRMLNLGRMVNPIATHMNIFGWRVVLCSTLLSFLLKSIITYASDMTLRCIYIYIYTCVYIYIYICTYRYIKYINLDIVCRATSQFFGFIESHQGISLESQDGKWSTPLAFQHNLEHGPLQDDLPVANGGVRERERYIYMYV